MLRELALSMLIAGACVPIALVACGSEQKFQPPPATASGTGASASGGTGGTTTTTGGSGGTGGAPCVDMDMDGVTDCAGDCDDNNPNVAPGQPEVCGDGVDNDCDGDSDPPAICMMLGTYVSALTGNDTTGDGTQSNPVQTIAKGMQNAVTLANGQPVFIGEGLYPEKVTVAEGISLLGGHQCDTVACTWARDPSQYDSAIINQDHSGVFVPDTVTRITFVDGLRIVGQSGNPGSNGTIVTVTIDRGTPTLSNNRIFGGQVIGCGGCGSAGIVINGPSNNTMGVLIDDNEITGGDSIDGTTAISMRNFQMAPVAEITDNDIRGGDGAWTRAVDAFSAGSGTRIANNLIHAGSTSGSGSFRSSFAMIVSGNATLPSEIVIDSNRINTNPTLVGSCLTANFWCGGVETEGATATISNNVIYGMPTAVRSVAVYLGEGEIPFGDLVINANTLHGGGSPNSPGAISAGIGCRTVQGTNATVGRIRNNIILGGSALNRFGFYEDDQTNGRTCQPVAYDNNDIHFSQLANANDAIHRQWTGTGMQVLITTVTALNALMYANANIAADPLLDATWHIQTGSPCINAGVATDAPTTDFEAQMRPQGNAVDIGADEAM